MRRGDSMIRNRESNEDAVVFGLFETGLGVIRSLGRKGIRVLGVDHRKDIGWYSRYADPRICPHPIRDRFRFIEWIRATLRDRPEPLPAFITADDYIGVLSEERETLAPFIKLNLAEDRLLKAVADKYTQAELATEAGIPIPKTWNLNGPENLKAVKPYLRWPMIIKGREVNAWRTAFGGNVKGFVVKNHEEFEMRLNDAFRSGVPVIAQEIIEGPDTRHFKYCAYVSKDGRTLAELCLKKIRQWPVRFGVGSAVISVEDEELLAYGRQFFRGIGYHGVGSAEFKRDARDGKLKLIELNTRYWQQNALAEACGVNFAWIQYQDLKKRLLASSPGQKNGVLWVNRYMDFSSFLVYHREGSLSWQAWRRSLKGKKVFADYATDDPLPAFYDIGFGKKLVRIPMFLWKRIRP